jgi:nucleoside-diphosphate-sugar epimerase
VNDLSTLRGARALVTGAAGFIGRHAVAALREAGADVFALARLAGVVAPPERTLLADITDAAAVDAAVAEAAPAFVLHLAGRKDRTSAVEDFGPLLTANAVGTCNVLAASAKVPGLRSFVTLGTAEEYGNQPCPFRESMREQPASAYSLSKTAVSHALRAAYRLHGVPAVELRPTLAYGPGQPPDLFLPALIKALAEGRHFPMSPGEQTRDFVFITDLIEAILAALVTPEAAGRVINIGSGEPVTLAELARKVERLMGLEGLVGFGEVPYRTGEVMDYWVDPSLARDLLGWTAHVGLDEGLRITIDDALGRR